MSGVLLLALLLGRLDSPVTERAEALGQRAVARAATPEGAAALVRLRELLDEVDDLNLVAEPASRVARGPGTEPQVRAVALGVLAEVERARGNTLKARGLVQELGYVQDWAVLGGFDNEGKSGCDTDFGPEGASLDLAGKASLGGREVAWVRPEARAADGYVDLSVPLRPATEAVGYAVTFLQAEAETRAVLSLGTSGGFRLFVNGVRVARSDRYNLPRPDQQRLEVRLHKGLNRVLLKVCQLSGPFGFYLRAVGPRGAALKAVVPATAPPLEKGPGPAPTPLPGLAELLEQQLKGQPGNAELRADYAVVLAFTRASPEAEKAPAREAERAALQRPKDAEVALNAAQLAEDFNDRRRWLDQALAAAPRHPFARLALAQLELSREHPELALKLAEALLAERPRFGQAWVAKVRALDALGERVAAARTAEAAFAALPQVPPVVREAASASRRLDRPDEALSRWRLALALRADDGNARRALASLLTELGRVDEAAEQLKRLLALDPFDTSTQLRLADLLAANGRLAEARGQYAAARALAPEEPEVPEREGRALLHAGEPAPALAAFQRSLQLRPQNPALKELVRTLKGEDLSLGSAEAYPLAELLAVPDAPAGEDAVVLAEVTHVKVQRSGLASRMQQVVARVLTQRGVEAFRSLPITWSPDRQEVRVMRARIKKPDGSLIESFSEADHAMEPWAGMYFDTRAKVLTFPALAPGDVLEVQWRLDDTAIDNLLSDYWGDVDAVQGPFAKRRYRYVVDMPTARPLHWNQATLPPQLTVATAAQGERTVYRFEAAGLPRLPAEPQMPGWAEVSGVLHLSTYASWEEVGRYYHGLVRDQLVPSEELRRTVAELLKGVDRSDARKVVAALYGFVVSNVRYVGLEFGIHGYQPYKVDRVLARRFGDCKDKASLLHAMLAVAGIDSRLVLLRTRDRGLLSPEVASLAAFNHAILYVPRLDRFLDGTAEYHGSTELPGQDREADVLVVEPGGVSRFLVTPQAAPEANTTDLQLEVALKPDGSADVKGQLTATGEGAPELRRTYETQATRVSVFERQWADRFPGVQAEEVTVSDPRALEAPAVLGMKFVVPRYALAGGGLLRFYPFGTSYAWAQALAPLPTRKTDTVLPGVWVNRLRFVYRGPPGWVVPSVPPEAVLDSPFGRLTVSARKESGGARLVVEGALTMKVSRVSAKDYPAFRQWLLEVDQALAVKLALQRGEESASAR